MPGCEQAFFNRLPLFLRQLGFSHSTQKAVIGGCLNRRQFLKALTLLGFTGLSTASLSGCNTPLGGLSQQTPITGWLGDDPNASHRIRQHTTAWPPADETMDVVIIGAGISGLTAAFQLRHVDKLLVLENSIIPGGNAKSAQYQGVEYALGSAYFVDTDEPFASLYQAIGVPLTPLKQPEDWLAEAPGQLAPLETGRFRQGFARLQRHIARLGQHKDFPRFPIDQASTASLALDTLPLADYLQALNLPVEVLQWVDAYCRSSMGCGSQAASAYVGLNFLSELALPVYALPGGNAGIVKRLVHHVGDTRIRTGALTHRVQHGTGRYMQVCYEHDGHMRTVQAKTVIMAVPLMVANRLLTSHGSQRFSPAGLGTLPYSSYVVANLCFDQRVLESGYDTWMPTCAHFTDVVDATYCLSDEFRNAKAPQVLTVYAPMPLSSRQGLLQATPQAVAKPLWQAAHQWLPTLPAPKAITMSRYGHQLLASKTGIIHQVRGLPQQMENLVFAHSDGQGAASVESAIWQGIAAAKMVLPLLVSA
jgi:predicted NAD/FAD-dependent oxidoreductase